MKVTLRSGGQSEVKRSSKGQEHLKVMGRSVGGHVKVKEIMKGSVEGHGKVRAKLRSWKGQKRVKVMERSVEG